MTRLTNKIAIITGGIVSHFLSQAAKVELIDIVDQKEGDAIVAKLASNGEAIYLQKDIGISAWSKELLDQYQQVLKGIPLKPLGDPEHDIAPVTVGSIMLH